MADQDSTPRLRKPKLTDRVIRGLIGATSFTLAGELEFEKQDIADMEAADQWARLMREYREARSKRSSDA